MIPIAGNKLNKMKVDIPKPKVKLMRKKAIKKVKMVEFEPEKLKFKKTFKKKGAY